MSSGKYNFFYLWRSEVRSEGGPGPQFAGSSRRKSFLSHPPSPFSSTLLEVTPHMVFPLLPTLLPMGGAHGMWPHPSDLCSATLPCWWLSCLSFRHRSLDLKLVWVIHNLLIGKPLHSSFQNLSPGRVTFTGPRDLNWACFGQTNLTPCVEEGSCWQSDEYLGVYYFCLFF